MVLAARALELLAEFILLLCAGGIAFAIYLLYLRRK